MQLLFELAFHQPAVHLSPPHFSLNLNYHFLSCDSSCISTITEHDFFFLFKYTVPVPVLNRPGSQGLLPCAPSSHLSTPSLLPLLFLYPSLLLSGQSHLPSFPLLLLSLKHYLSPIFSQSLCSVKIIFTISQTHSAVYHQPSLFSQNHNHPTIKLSVLSTLSCKQKTQHHRTTPQNHKHNPITNS